METKEQPTDSISDTRSEHCYRHRIISSVSLKSDN